MTGARRRTSASTPHKRPGAWRWWIAGLVAVAVIALAAFVALRHVLRADYLEQQLAEAVAASTDSLYRVEIGTVDFSLKRRSFIFRHIVLEPDTLVLERRRAAGTLPPVRYAVTAPSVRLHGVHLWSLLRHRDLKLQTLQLPQPHVHLTLDEERTTAKQADTPAEDPAAHPLHVRIARQLPYVQVGRVHIDSASVSWEIQGRKKERQDIIEGISVLLDHVVIDSASARDTSRVLFSEDVQLTLPGYRRVSSDGLYVFEAGPMRGSSKTASFTVASLRWEPTASDAAFMRRQAYRTNRYKARSGAISLEGVDFRGLLEQGTVAVLSVSVDTPMVDVYYDRTLPARGRTSPAELPHQAFQSIRTPLRIDTVRVKRGDIRYSERAADGARPGTIRFDEVWGTVYNVTNDPGRMTPSTPAVIDAWARVAGAGRLDAQIDYALLAPRLRMAYRGTLGPMDARAFNAVFVDLEGIRITRGHIDSLWFDVKVEQDVASGALQVLYQDLAIESLDKATGQRNLGKRLETLITNRLVLRSENVPRDGTPARVAVLRHEREAGDPLFKFIWETLRSGLFSTLGL